MERDTDKKTGKEETESKDTSPNYEQNGGHFIEDEQATPGEGLLHHGRPLSEMEIDELRIHKENNRFLGIADTPEVGTGEGNVGGAIPDSSDMLSADDLEDHTARDSNFGRNYQGGLQSTSHFIETASDKHWDNHKDKKD